MRSLPDFLIIGAQRCGTTSLYSALVSLPDVNAAFRKEVHFFDRHYLRGEAWYRSNFPPTWRPGTTGEATPNYLFDPRAPARVKALVPDCKLVVVLRDPVERTLSSWRLKRRHGREDLSLRAALQAEKGRIHSDYERASDGLEPDSPDMFHHAYVGKSLYAEQIERWLQEFSRDQILVETTERLFNTDSAALIDVAKFIGSQGASPAPRLPWLNATTPDSAEEAEVAAELRSYFEAPNERLFSLLGWDPQWQQP